jgi:hypothetical protein
VSFRMLDVVIFNEDAVSGDSVRQDVATSAVVVPDVVLNENRSFLGDGST